MAYPLTFPSYPFPKRVRVRKQYAQAMTQSPTTFTQQIYKHPGKRFVIEVTIQKCTSSEAEIWTAFFDGLEGMEGTFALNLNPYCPGMSPAPGTLNFRLNEPEIGWDTEFATLFDFTFTAVQDK